MVPGRPSVLFRRQLVHICGMICIHQQLQSQLPLVNSSRFSQGLDVGFYIHFTQVSIGPFSHKQSRRYSPVPRV
jgi:hypothetical protein